MIIFPVVPKVHSLVVAAVAVIAAVAVVADDFTLSKYLYDNIRNTNSP